MFEFTLLLVHVTSSSARLSILHVAKDSLFYDFQYKMHYFPYKARKALLSKRVSRTRKWYPSAVLAILAKCFCVYSGYVLLYLLRYLLYFHSFYLIGYIHTVYFMMRLYYCWMKSNTNPLCGVSYIMLYIYYKITHDGAVIARISVQRSDVEQT